MFLLSQGSWVKVIAPDEFVKEMKDEIEKCGRCIKNVLLKMLPVSWLACGEVY